MDVRKGIIECRMSSGERGGVAKPEGLLSEREKVRSGGKLLKEGLRGADGGCLPACQEE